MYLVTNMEKTTKNGEQFTHYNVQDNTQDLSQDNPLHHSVDLIV